MRNVTKYACSTSPISGTECNVIGTVRVSTSQVCMVATHMRTPGGVPPKRTWSRTRCGTTIGFIRPSIASAIFTAHLANTGRAPSTTRAFCSPRASALTIGSTATSRSFIQPLLQTAHTVRTTTSASLLTHVFCGTASPTPALRVFVKLVASGASNLIQPRL